MNREQMEAWCALEGLIPVTRGHPTDGKLPRVIHLSHRKYDDILQVYDGEWVVARSSYTRDQYEECNWEDHPAFGELTIELLTQLKNQ